MILYLDTSALVKKYFEESNSSEVTSAWKSAYEGKPNDIFEFVLNHVDYPARPRNHLEHQRKIKQFFGAILRKNSPIPV